MAGGWALGMMTGLRLGARIHRAAGWAASALNGPFWTIWAVLNGLLAASYAASWIVFHDEDGA